MLITAEAPTRVDLAGGTVDLWPIHHNIGAHATINAAISLRTSARMSVGGPEFVLESLDQKLSFRGNFMELRRQQQFPLLADLLGLIWNDKLPAFQLQTHSECPAGSGLGGSSSLLIAVAKALYDARELLTGEKEPPEAQLVCMLKDLESKVIRCPAGDQDHWGALRGHLNILTYAPGATVVDTYEQHPFATHLQNEVMLVLSPGTRPSRSTNWSVYKGFFDQEPKIVQALERIGQLSYAMAEALREQNWDKFTGLCAEEAQVREAELPGIVTPELGQIIAAAKESGAPFVRICGAGGGGGCVVFAPKERHTHIAEAVTAVGGRPLPVEFSVPGVRVRRQN